MATLANMVLVHTWANEFTDYMGILILISGPPNQFIFKLAPWHEGRGRSSI